MCANRIYVQSAVYADFASRLAAKVSAFKMGNGLEKDSSVHIPSTGKINIDTRTLDTGHMALLYTRAQSRKLSDM